MYAEHWGSKEPSEKEQSVLLGPGCNAQLSTPTHTWPSGCCSNLHFGFSHCDGAWLSTPKSTSAGLFSCCSAVPEGQETFDVWWGSRKTDPLCSQCSVFPVIATQQWRDHDSVTDLLEMLKIGVTGMGAKKGRPEDEAGVKDWIVWTVGLDRELAGQGNGDKHEWSWQVHLHSCVNIHNVWDEIFFITWPEIHFLDIKFCTLCNSSAESDVNWCLQLQCCLRLILWLGLACDRWHLGFQRTKGLPGTPIWSRCSYSFYEKKKHMENSVYSRERKWTGKAPTQAFPLPWTEAGSWHRSSEHLGAGKIRQIHTDEKRLRCAP